MAIYEFVGYPTEPSVMLACSIWSFATALVQIIETIMTLQDKGQKLLSNTLVSTKGIDLSKSLDNSDVWYDKKHKRYVQLGEGIWCFGTIITILFFVRILGFRNDAMASGFTLLSLALFFACTVFKEKVEEKLKKDAVEGLIINGQSGNQRKI